MRFEPQLQQVMNTVYDIAGWSPLRHGIKTLSPGRRVAALFDNTVDLHRADSPRVYSVRIDYKDGHGRQQPPLHYDIDLTHLFGASYVAELTVHDLAKTVREIEVTLGKFRTEGAGCSNLRGRVVATRRRPRLDGGAEAAGPKVASYVDG